MAPSLEGKLVHLKSLVQRGLIDPDMARAEQARLLREELGGGSPTSRGAPVAPEPVDDRADATVYREGGDRDLKMARQYIVLSQRDRVHRVRRETPGHDPTPLLPRAHAHARSRGLRRREVRLRGAFGHPHRERGPPLRRRRGPGHRLRRGADP